MKKQRWRWTKGKLWFCDSCFTSIRVKRNYKPEHCCNGFECGCYGMPINPVFCDKCEQKIFGKVLR
ncbi:hypothetical protein HPT25_23700 [Bacillus sp. BRMEA1]|uniref:hypothetical protein n=1 Tax=Neobacillus endophyticus TaxID=2738405 RepID=UPI001564D514|nr:hypothetical protein [Neobacillus endophyticus]NRD80331.1 hypothetical protein [Neobacillus endophyticus]